MTPKEKVIEVLKNHDLMSLATIGTNGKPKVRSVDFAMDENPNFLYFITNKHTDKVEELKTNNNVHLCIDHPCDSMEMLQELRYVKASGKAFIETEPEMIQKGFGLIMQKFPYLKNLPGDPSDFLAIRVELDEVFLTDNTVRFGHTEKVDLN